MEGRRVATEQRDSLGEVEVNFVKEQLKVSSRKLAESQMAVQELKAALSSQVEVSGNRINGEIERLNKKLMENENELEGKARELQNSVLAGNKYKEMVKKMESQLQDQMKMSETFKNNLDTDRAVLEELR